MGRPCTVCTHPQIDAINKALAAGESHQSVADRFGLAASSVGRHKRKHLPAEIAKAAKVEEVAAADNLLQFLTGLQEEAAEVAGKGKRRGDGRLELQAIKTQLDVVSTLVQWRMSELAAGPAVEVHLSDLERLPPETLTDAELDLLVKLQARAGGYPVPDVAALSDEELEALAPPRGTPSPPPSPIADARLGELEELIDDLRGRLDAAEAGQQQARAEADAARKEADLERAKAEKARAELKLERAMYVR